VAAPAEAPVAAPANAEVARVEAEISRLTEQMFDVESRLRAENAVVARAYQDMLEARRQYDVLLSAADEYADLERQRARLMNQHEALRQGGRSLGIAEERKTP
jgi:chromosome segregation ATPase